MNFIVHNQTNEFWGSLTSRIFVPFIFNAYFRIQGKGNLENVYLFSRKFQRCHHQCVKSLEMNFKKLSKSLPTMAGHWRKFWFLGPPKHLFHYSENTSVAKQTGSKSTNSECLIPFRKIWLSQLSIQRGGNFINFVFIQGQ